MYRFKYKVRSLSPQRAVDVSRGELVTDKFATALDEALGQVMVGWEVLSVKVSRKERVS